MNIHVFLDFLRTLSGDGKLFAALILGALVVFVPQPVPKVIGLRSIVRFGLLVVGMSLTTVMEFAPKSPGDPSPIAAFVTAIILAAILLAVIILPLFEICGRGWKRVRRRFQISSATASQ